MYVPSQNNPADLVSRGCTAQQLCKEETWFSGPEFLKGSQREWPKQPSEKIVLQEFERTLKIVLTTNTTELSLLDCINHGNSFQQLQRVMAFIIRGIRRFKLKVRPSIKKPISEIAMPTTEEMEAASLKIFSMVQQTAYSTEIKCLNQQRPLPKANSLTSLTPFIDETGILRVGGRLQQSSLTYDEQHPILLPPTHFVTRLYMALVHVRNLHAGPQAITAISRQRVWIPQGRQLARSIVNSCIRCFRTRPKCAAQIMGQLPASRLTVARPFINCGVDFCGPIYTHFKIRGKKTQKTYIAVFCCFATKAVHLEVVSDLTTNSFIGALKRFMARRGSCQNIYCDNATNFTGAYNQITELQDIVFGKKASEQILNHCNHRRIQFHFIPPRTPHMGGLWEAAVRSSKCLLCRAVKSTALTYEELCTVTAEIEAVLNSRPLTPMSSDPNDFNTLTPGHFLVGEPTVATVDPHASDQRMSLLSRWQLVSYCRGEFWKRWSIKYITGLQQRAKWAKEYPDMLIGTLVILKEDNLPPLQWTLGRIETMSYGPDGHARVAWVRTPTGTLRRAIHSLAPLPVELDDKNDQPSSHNSNTTRLGEEVSPEPVSTRPNHQGQRQRKRTGSTSSRVTRRSRVASTLTTLLLILPVIFPLADTTNGKRFDIQQLENNAGIFYDHQGQLQLSPTKWTIMAFFNLDGYWAIDNGIENLIGRMKATSENISQSGPYKETIQHFSMRLNHLRQVNHVLMPPTQSRKRRAAMNIVGTVFNKLFGILDDDYAQEMKTTIGNVQTNEVKLNQLLSDHTSILDSTLNLIKRDRADILNHTTSLKSIIDDNFLKLSNQVSREIQESRALEYFNLLSTLVISYLHEYEQIQDNIADITLGLHQGHTSIHIISPTQLQSQLDIIRQQLATSLSLPQTQQSDLQALYKIMTTQGRVSGGYYLFKIQIPLLSSNRFHLYRLLSVPVLLNNSQVTIEPTTEDLAIDLHNNQFYALTESELRNCALLTPEMHILMFSR